MIWIYSVFKKSKYRFTRINVDIYSNFLIDQKAVPIKSTAGVTAKSSPGVNVLKKSTVTGVPARSSPLTAVRNVPSWTPPGNVGNRELLFFLLFLGIHLY